MDHSKAVIRQRSTPSRRRKDGLIRFAADNTSQNGEDGVLERIFELIPCSEPRRWCVDVGAWDGVHLSNTFSLLRDRTTWRGILVEADSTRFDQLCRLYNETNNICVRATVACDASKGSALNSLIYEHAADCPVNFDFLCIDIDGSDYWVLHDLLLEGHFHPKVVCIEFNPSMPDDLIYIPPRNDDVRHGASLAALVELAESHDYVLVETTLFNGFFVTKDLYREYLCHEVPETSIESLHETTMGTTLYQLYDGTIKLAGCKKLLWHRLPIEEDNLQVLPTKQRHFPFAPSLVPDETDVFDFTCVIDVSPIFSGVDCSDKARKTCCSQLIASLHSDGFCYIRGTGMAPNICRAALTATSAFLQEADESVRRSCLAQDRARRGYSPMNGENFASLIGERGPNDLVRKFRVGAEGGNNPLRQPNVWPPETLWDGATGFRTAVEEFYDAACPMAQTIVQAICEGLASLKPELDEKLRPLRKGPVVSTTTSILTLLGYRPGSRHKGKSKGPLVAAHTDVGVITVLLFEGGKKCAALERSDGDGGWVEVNLPLAVPEDPVFVVNVADCFSEVANGEISSTLHRVVACRGTSMPRNACALFVGLQPGTELDIEGDKLTYEEWRKRRVARSQAALRQHTTLEFDRSSTLGNAG